MNRLPENAPDPIAPIVAVRRSDFANAALSTLGNPDTKI